MENQDKTDWTVYSMNISRDNLDKEQDPNDPRTHVGWKEGQSKAMNAAQSEDSNSSWISTTEQQPLMSWVGTPTTDNQP